MPNILKLDNDEANSTGKKGGSEDLPDHPKYKWRSNYCMCFSETGAETGKFPVEQTTFLK